MLSVNKLPRAKRIEIITFLVEGMSLRAVTRVTGVSINTVTKLLVDAGQACTEYQDKAFGGLTCRRLQLDEIWSFCYAKAKNVKTAKAAPDGAGDVWTWTAIDADTKLIPSWLVASRDSVAAYEFCRDLAGRLAHRVQVLTDGHAPYMTAIPRAFGDEIDYGVLVKHYGAPKGEVEAHRRYSPAVCISAEAHPQLGAPDEAHISTSYVERQNLTMRMNMRRFTRLTNAFSKKAENHAHAVALHFMYYNFVRIHQTLRCPPAMRAGVTDRLWDVSDIVKMVENWEARQVQAAA
jgi:IS1 family transposase